MDNRKKILEKTIRQARAELGAMTDEEDRSESEKLIGNCYSYRNCYSCPQEESDYWNMYVRIIGVDGGCVSVIQFQSDGKGRSTLERHERSYTTFKDGGYKLIPLSVFIREWHSFVNVAVEAFGADVRKKIEATNNVA